jgi:hypothetical protein
MIVQVKLEATPEGWTFSAVDAGGRTVAQWGGRRKSDNEFVLFGAARTSSRRPCSMSFQSTSRRACFGSRPRRRKVTIRRRAGE